jgi:hypothetical protein
VLRLGNLLHANGDLHGPRLYPLSLASLRSRSGAPSARDWVVG